MRPAPFSFDLVTGFQQIAKIKEDLDNLVSNYKQSLEDTKKDHRELLASFIEGLRTDVLDSLQKYSDSLDTKADKTIQKFSNKVDNKLSEVDGVVVGLKKIITKGDKGDSIKGDSGYTPKKGIDYFTPAEQKKIIKEIKDSIKLPKDGRDAVLTNEILWGMIEKLPKGKRFKMEHVDGLDQTLSALRNLAARGGVRGGGDTIAAGSNVTITTDSVGRKVIASSGGAGSGFQAPTSGAVDGSNTVFVWATAPKAIVVDQGRAMQKTSTDSTVNWTGTTTTTLTVAPTTDIYAVA